MARAPPPAAPPRSTTRVSRPPTVALQGDEGDRGPPIDAADLPPLDQPTTRQPKQRSRKARRDREGSIAWAGLDGFPSLNLRPLSTLVANFRSQFRRGRDAPFHYDDDEASHK